MEHAVDYAPTYSRKLTFRWVKRFIYLAVTLGLIASNIASVLSTTFHDLLYKMVAAELTAIAPTKAARLLARAPAVRLSSTTSKLTNTTRLLSTTNMKLAATSSELASTTSKLGHAKASVKNFKARAVKRLVRQKAVSLATLPERVVPVFGVAIIAGATIYEINSDCELFKEINQLTQVVDAQSTAPNEDEICGFAIPSGGMKEAWSEFRTEMSHIDAKQQLNEWMKSITSD